MSGPRAAWKIKIGSEDDSLLAQRLPHERAELTWDFSRELYTIAALNGGVYDEETGVFVNVDGETLNEDFLALLSSLLDAEARSAFMAGRGRRRTSTSGSKRHQRTHEE